MTSADTVQAETPLALAATVAPNNATNQAITWSVHDAGTTGATISGNTLNTTAAGTVTVRATITNGATASTNFTQDFTITVTVTAPQTNSEAAAAARAALNAFPVSNATTQADIMAVVQGAITNPDIQAWWSASGVIFILTPATTSATGSIAISIFLGYAPPLFNEQIVLTLIIPQL